MFLFYETREKTNRQRKVFKSLVICNYASKKATTNHTNTVKQNEQNTNTSIFLFLFDGSHLFFRESMREKFVQQQQQQQCDIYGFFIFESLEEGLPEESSSRILPRIGFIFSSKFFGFHTRCLLTKTVCSKT